MLLPLIVRVSSRKNEARLHITPNNPKSDQEPPPSTTSRAPPRPLRNATALHTLRERSESIPRCAEMCYNARIPCSSPACLLVRHTPLRHRPYRRAPTRLSKHGWREKHQYSNSTSTSTSTSSNSTTTTSTTRDGSTSASQVRAGQRAARHSATTRSCSHSGQDSTNRGEHPGGKLAAHLAVSEQAEQDMARGHLSPLHRQLALAHQLQNTSGSSDRNSW